MFGAVLAALLLAAPAQAAKPPAYDAFELVSQFGPPPGPTSGTQTPEIADVTPDGMRLFSTLGERGFSAYDLSDPAAPKFLRTIGVGNGGYVTSVNVTPDGRHLLVTQKPIGTLQTGRLSVFDAQTLQPLVTWPINGQPDGVAISPDGAWALIAIENEGTVQGELVRVKLDGADPTDWELNRLLFDAADPALANPNDIQPEFVDIRPDNTAVVTLQENNAVAVVDLPRNTISDIWSTGRTSSQLADRNRSANRISFTDALTDRTNTTLGAPREPDAIGFLPDGQHVITANEGEAGLGGRSFTIFKLDGTLVYDSKELAEKYLADRGLYPDDRSTAHGAEFEGVEVATFGRTTVAAIGAERGDAVLFVDVTDPTQPKMIQASPSGGEPEGLVAVPQRNLLIAVDAGAPRGFTIFRPALRRDLADGVRQIAADNTPLYRLQGLTAVDSTRLAVLHGGLQNATAGHILELALRRTGGVATGVASTPITLNGAAVTFDYGGDLALDPLTGGWWVSANQGLLRVAPDGKAEKALDGYAAALTVSADGGTVYLEGEERRLVAYAVQARTTRTFVLPETLDNRLDLATAPDGALVVLTREPFGSEPREFGRKIWRVPVAGLADGATVEPQLVAETNAQPLFADYGDGDQLLTVTPSGDVWVTGETSTLRNLGRLFPPARPGAPATGALPSDQGKPTAWRVRDLVNGFATNGPRIYATGDNNLSALSHETGPLAVIDPRTGPVDGWPRVNGTVAAMVSDGHGGAYLAGAFTRVGTTERAGVAHIRADGTLSDWAPQPGGPITALLLDGTTVYLGGTFGVAAVSADGTGTAVAGFTPIPVSGGTVRALARGGTRLAVGGTFTQAGGAEHTGLALADAATGAVDHAWAPPLSFEGDVFDVILSGSRVYAAGSFFASEGETVRSGIAAFNVTGSGAIDAAFVPPAAPAGSVEIRSFVLDGNRLYVAASGGYSTLPGPVFAVDAATGTVISAFAPTPATSGASGGKLALIGGQVWHASPAGRITGLDPQTGAVRSSYALGSDEGGQMTFGGVVANGSQVAVGGSFTYSGVATRAFAFDARTGIVDPRFNLPGAAPRLLTLAGGWLYFVASDRASLRRADPEDGGIDESFTLDVAGSIHALAAQGDRLLVGGEFTFLDGIGRINLAALDARTGRVLPGFANPADGRVLRLAVTDDRVYVARRSIVGAAYGIAVEAYTLDGASVGTFAGELPERWDTIDVLRKDTDGALLVGGGALNGQLGGALRLDPVTGARRPGFSVTTNGAVTAVQRHGGAVFIAGRFSTVGELERRGLAALDAATGAPIAAWDAKLEADAYALYSYGSKLWVGGWFNRLGETPAGGVASFEALPPVASAPPAIGGTARVEETVSCTTGEWRNFPVAYAYAWQLDGAAVAGATTATYTLPESAAGKALTCSVLASNDTGASQPSVSAPVTVTIGAPVNTAVPAVTGVAKRGSTLTCSTGSWSRNPTAYARQWLRDGAPINGATGETRIATSADVGRALACRVIATNAGGDSAPAVSAPVTVVADAPESLAAPEVLGAATVGGELRCDRGSWSNDPDSYAYAWLLDGVAVGEGATWTVPAAAAGRLVRCGVTATNPGGTSAQALSAPVTIATTPAAPVVVEAPTGRKPVRAKLGAVRAGKVSVQITCPEGEVCRGRIELKVGSRVVGRATYNVRAGAAKTVKVKVPKTARASKLKLVLRAS